MHAIRVNAAITDRLKARGHIVAGLTEGGCPAVESIGGDNGVTHLVFSQAACTAILADESFAPSDLASPVVALGRAFGIDVAAVQSFFLHVPLVARGLDHDGKRSRFLQHHNLARRRHSAFIRRAAEVACRGLADAQGPVMVTEVASGYVDNILRHIFETELAGSGALFDRLAEVHSSVLDYVHHPRLLAETAARMADFLRGFDLNPDECPDEREELPFVLLGYVLMGRDPLIGALGALLSSLGTARPRGSELESRLSEMSARNLFQQVCPVNYIGRMATAAREIEGARIRSGEQVFLFLPYANAQGCATERFSGLAFGHGSHVCAGTALSLEIADAFIDELRAIGSRFDVKKVRPGLPVAGVFLRYRESA